MSAASGQRGVREACAGLTREGELAAGDVWIGRQSLSLSAPAESPVED